MRHSIYTIYRVSIWLPMLVPAVLIVAVNTLGLHPDFFPAQILGFSLLYGGLPYVALAAWATWWVGGRSEAAIRRLMYWAPVLMVAVFVPVALVVGFASGRVEPFVGVAMLGSVVIIPLGYAYVGLAVLLRHGFGPRAA